MNGLVINCSECGKSNYFSLSANDGKCVDIKHKVPYDCEGERIYLTYFDCAGCGKRHFVQIDNFGTIQDYNKCISYMRSLSTCKKNNKPVSKKDSDKFKKLRAKIAESRLMLMKKYSGKDVTDASGNITPSIEFTLTN